MNFDFNTVKQNKRPNLSEAFIDKDAINRLFFILFDDREKIEFSRDYSQCKFPDKTTGMIPLVIPDFCPFLMRTIDFFKCLDSLIIAKISIVNGTLFPCLRLRNDNISLSKTKNIFILNFLKALKSINAISLYYVNRLDLEHGALFEEITEKTKCVIIENIYYPNRDLLWPFSIKSENSIVKMASRPTIDYEVLQFKGIYSNNISIPLEMEADKSEKKTLYKRYIDWVINLIKNPSVEIMVKYRRDEDESILEWLRAYIGRLSSNMNISLSSLKY